MPYKDDYVTCLPKEPVEAISRVLGDFLTNNANPTAVEFFETRDLIFALSIHHQFRLQVDIDTNDTERLATFSVEQNK